jgi:microcystin-dependent protein
MTLVFANNAAAQLAATATVSDTVLVLGAGEGARFPSPGAGQSFIATIQEGTQFEIVECTSRTGDNLTVVRAREGTAAQTWGVGSSVTMRNTAGTMAALEQRARALAEFAPINGPISLSADPADPTHAVRESYLAGRETAIRDDMNTLVQQRETAIRDDMNTLAQRCRRLVGEVIEYYGMDTPNGFLFCDGSERFRTVYAELFNAITRALTVTVVAGSPTVTVTAGSLTHIVAGMPISMATYFPAGTTIVSVGTGTLTLSANALFSDTGKELRVCPYGAGNNTTTFNLPDRRGRVAFTRSDTSGRLTSAVSGVDGPRLGATGGDQRLHQHFHNITQTPHTHAASSDMQGEHAHLYNETLIGVGAFFFGTSGDNVTQRLTATSVVGAHAHNIFISAANANITMNNAGEGSSQNIPPAIVCNHVIFTNVFS